jgi:hypothetical protein
MRRSDSKHQPPSTHRVKWQRWPDKLQSSYPSKRQICPPVHRRDFSNEGEAREFARGLRNRYGGPDRCLIAVERLVHEPTPTTPAFSDAYPWTGRGRLTS